MYVDSLLFGGLFDALLKNPCEEVIYRLNRL